jgi:hypothetical protein
LDTIFVCNDDGFVVLRFVEFNLVLKDTHNGVGWVKISRNPREMYLVKGSNGELPFKVGRNELPEKILLKNDEAYR